MVRHKMSANRVVVTGLRGKAWNSSRVKDAFIPFGPIQEVTLPKEGNAVIVFKYAADAREAVDNMNGAEVEGGYIRVELANSQRQEDFRINAKQAVWGKTARIGEEEAGS